jgi:hypothetical protein
MVAGMSDDSLAWLAGLAPAVQIGLLADPRGVLPPDVMARMPGFVKKAYWNGNPVTGRW